MLRGQGARAVEARQSCHPWQTSAISGAHDEKEFSTKESEAALPTESAAPEYSAESGRTFAQQVV
jgi:hypothetical protein